MLTNQYNYRITHIAARIRAILARRDAAAVLLCATPDNIERSAFPPRSLARRLAAGNTPYWLVPAATLPGNPNVRLYTVAPATP